MRSGTFSAKEHPTFIAAVPVEPNDQARQLCESYANVAILFHNVRKRATDVAPTDEIPGRLRIAVARAARPLVHLYWRVSRGLTLGVRGVVIDAQDRVFLVKHTYVGGWHLPGGGVEPGESVFDALARELKEEGNIEVVGTPAQFAVYFHPTVSKRDHVVLFVVRDFCQPAPPVPDREIMAHGFFPRNALPPDTTRGTRARIAEVMTGTTVS
ncbi:MAG: NUDIX domain-containing protein, partial [Bradyrhizobiaceae bacterium]|nr:NUDIX domain-containing protein [Bradyrhizobiaceae bacterium]